MLLHGAWSPALGYALRYIHDTAPPSYRAKREIVERGWHWFERITLELVDMELEISAVSGTLHHDLMEDYLFATSEAVVFHAHRASDLLYLATDARDRLDLWIAERGDRARVAFMFDAYHKTEEPMFAGEELAEHLRCGSFPWFLTDASTNENLMAPFKALVQLERQSLARDHGG